MQPLILVVVLLFMPTVAACAEQPHPPSFASASGVIQTATGRHSLTLELAETPEQQQHGLMFRRDMPRDTGMLFLFPQPDYITMWMKNTYIPLDMVFLDTNGTVVHVHRSAVPHSLETIATPAPAQMVLEVNAGVADALLISQGDILTYERRVSQ